MFLTTSVTAEGVVAKYIVVVVSGVWWINWEAQFASDTDEEAEG